MWHSWHLQSRAQMTLPLISFLHVNSRHICYCSISLWQFWHSFNHTLSLALNQFYTFFSTTLVPLTSGIFPLGKKGPNEFLPFYLRCEAHRQNDWDDVSSLDSRLWTDRSGPRPLIIPAPMSLMSSCQHFEYFLSLMGWKFSGLDSDWMML